MTVQDLRRKLLERTEATDARIILHLATGLDEIHQITESSMKLDDETVRKAEKLLETRLSGVPMAYITGEKEFYGLPFHVSDSVLIPRPDTEILVDTAIELSRNFSNPRILDLCTGSGAVGSAIAHELSLSVALSDISEKALSTAKENYLRNTGHEAYAREGNLFEPWTGSIFDIIVSNPPYLTESWYEETEKDVKAEPRLALVGGGDDGLDIIRKIILKAPSYLSEDGFLAIECDYRQTDICGKLLKMAGFSDIQIRKDLAGKERVVYGRRNPQ